MKTVLANGCFDCLHYGHVLHLQAARDMGDLLVVSVTDDEHVNKPGRPIWKELQRAAMLKALWCVDDVLIVPDLLTALKKVKPDILVKGQDYVGKIEPVHEVYCLMNGIEIKFTDTPKYSTTDLIHELERR